MKRKSSSSVIVLAVIASVGAGGVGAEVAQPSPNAQVAQAVPAEQVYRNSGSLMRTASYQPREQDARPGQTRMDTVSLLAVPAPTPREIKKHALVQIIIHEESQATSKAQTDSKRDTTLDAHLDQYLKLTKDLTLKQINNPLAVVGGTSTEFKGDGQADRSDSFVTRIGAEVIDVKPNGTLLLQARKHIKLDEEEQDYILSGVCRVEDVGLDNTVLSTQLHDLDLTKKTKGIVSDANKHGFFTKLLDTFNPF